jgi:drug/metabolite transporter (DMT)-like permease
LYPAATKYDETLLHLLALAGVLSISFSAVFVRLAAVSPVTATFYRAAYALPVLGIVWWYTRTGDRRPRRARLLGAASGVLLAIDLAFWHQSIGLIGVGLATVVANVQILFVAVGAWVIYDERPKPHAVWIIAGVMCGLALTSGLARPDAYGSAPVLGTVLSVLAGAFYAAFLLMFRAANRSLGPTAGPLLDATIGVLIGALLVSPIDPRFALTPSLPAHAWLAALAHVSQVGGWLLIATALPRLPAIETSMLLLVQPVFALLWGVLFFDERLSTLQWLGSALVLAGVATLSRLAGGGGEPARLSILDERP